MSSRMLDSTAIGCWGRLICRRMLGSGGAWAYTGTTEAAPTSSIAIRITLFMASSKFSPFRGAKSTPRRLVPVVLCPSFSYAAWGVTKRREKPIPTNEEHPHEHRSEAGRRGGRSHLQMAVRRSQYQAGARQGDRRPRHPRRHALGRGRGHRPKV